MPNQRQHLPDLLQALEQNQIGPHDDHAAHFLPQSPIKRKQCLLKVTICACVNLKPYISLTILGKLADCYLHAAIWWGPRQLWIERLDSMAYTPPNRLGGFPVPTTPLARKPDLPPMRRYFATYLTNQNEIEDLQRVGPAVSEFEIGFSAFARGTLIATEHGQVAIDDLSPGTRVKTVNNGYRRLRWIGSMTHVPNPRQQGNGGLTRISADSFGLGRPMPDLLIGPGAKLFRTSPQDRCATGSPTPANELADGDSVMQVSPISPVELYHIAFDAPQIIWANGMECETFHAETMISPQFGGEMRALFMSMFPYLSQPIVNRSIYPTMRPPASVA